MKRPSIVEFYQDEKGEWRWRVRAGNGRIVGDSAEGYKRRPDAETGFSLVALAVRKGVGA